MKRLLVLGIMISAIGCFAWAQDFAPEEPAIVLPPKLLKVEDLQVDNVQAALPKEENQLQPDVSVPLPQAEALYIPEEAFDVPFPEQVLTGQSTASTSQPPARSSIFSDGQIGVGSMNHVVGDISVYKLGLSPRFSLHFYHETLDGYQFRDAGTGYFHNDDKLTGTFSYAGSSASLNADGGISEASEGLQGNGDFYSLTHRFLNGHALFDYKPSSIVTLSGELHGSYATQVLSSSSPPTGAAQNDYELHLSPDAALALQFNAWSMSLTAGYQLLDYSTPGSPVGKFNGLLDIKVPLLDNLTLSVDGGAQWTVGDGIEVPAYVTLSGSLSPAFVFTVSGGHRVDPILFASLWDTSPLLELQGVPADNVVWFGSIQGQVRPMNNLLLNLKSEFTYADAAILPASTPDPNTGLFAYTQGSQTSLLSSVDITWDINHNFRLETKWTGRFIDRPAFVPSNEFGLEFDAQDNLDRVGGSLSATMNLGLATLLPKLQIGAFYRVSDGVMFRLDGYDLLAPLLTSGRPYWTGYVEPGLRVIITTRISL